MASSTGLDKPYGLETQPLIDPQIYTYVYMIINYMCIGVVCMDQAKRLERGFVELRHLTLHATLQTYLKSILVFQSHRCVIHMRGCHVLVQHERS